MVLIFSRNANSSPNVRREVERAVSKGLTLIPFRIENVEPSDAFELFLSLPQWIDAYAGPPEKHLDRLCDEVRAALDARGGVSAPSSPGSGGQRVSGMPSRQQLDEETRGGALPWKEIAVGAGVVLAALIGLIWFFRRRTLLHATRMSKRGRARVPVGRSDAFRSSRRPRLRTDLP